MSDSPKTAPVVRSIILALVLFASASIGFLSIADEVRDGDTLAYDEAILKSINSFASPALDKFFVVATELGGFVAVPIITAVIAALLIRARRRYMAIVLLAGVSGAAALNLLVRLIFERARPDLWEQLIVEASFSFPSGHAMASSALAISVVAILWRTKWRVLSIVVGSLYMILIGFSRLYLGVHYPTDVIAGWLMSLSWILIVVGLVALYRQRRLGGSHSVAVE